MDDSAQRLNEKGFVASLQYLKKEAEQSGLEELGKVLGAALAVVVDDTAEFQRLLGTFLEDSASYDDAHRVIEFLFRFLMSSESARQSFLMELDNKNCHAGPL